MYKMTENQEPKNSDDPVDDPFNSAERVQRLLDGVLSDCTVVVQDETQQREFPVHKAILSLHSSVFESIFTAPMIEQSSNIVKIQGFNPDRFGKILRYLYGSKENTKIENLEEALEMFSIAHTYVIEGLIYICLLFIQEVITFENACEVYCFLHRFHKQFYVQEIYDAMYKCTDVIMENLKELIQNSKKNGYDLEKEVLEMILVEINGCYDTGMSVIEVFEFVEEWTEVEIKRRGIEDNEEKKTQLRKDLASKICFLHMKPRTFASSPAKSTLLSLEEKFSILMNLVKPDSVPMPDGFRVHKKQKTPIRYPSRDEEYEGECDCIQCMMKACRSPLAMDALLVPPRAMPQASRRRCSDGPGDHLLPQRARSLTGPPSTSVAVPPRKATLGSFLGRPVPPSPQVSTRHLVRATSNPPTDSDNDSDD